MGLYSNGQMMMDPIYGQILYNCCLSKDFKMKLGNNLQIFMVDITKATEKDIAEHIIRTRKVIPASRVKVTCVQLVIIIHRIWKVLKTVEERSERRMVGKRIIFVLM